MTRSKNTIILECVTPADENGNMVFIWNPEVRFSTVPEATDFLDSHPHPGYGGKDRGFVMVAKINRMRAAGDVCMMSSGCPDLFDHGVAFARVLAKLKESGQIMQSRERADAKVFINMGLAGCYAAGKVPVTKARGRDGFKSADIHHRILASQVLRLTKELQELRNVC